MGSGLVYQIGPGCIHDPADIIFTRGGEQVQIHQTVRMIGSFRVTMMVCSNCAAMALSAVRSDQPSCSSRMPALTGGQERLDGNHQPVLQYTMVARVIEIPDFAWLLVQAAADAMTGQLIDDVIASPGRFLLDGLADAVQRTACAREAHGLVQRRFRGFEQFVDLGCSFGYPERGARVRKVPIQLGRDIDVDEIPVFQDVSAGNAMCNDRRNTDAGRPG